MKTSNKILTGFAVIVFILPVISAFIIKEKVNRGEYVTGSDNFPQLPGADKIRPFPTGHYSVIKLNGNNGHISCSLYGSEKEGYFNTGANKWGDSVSLHCANDTLYINTIQAPREGPQRYYDVLYLQLYTKSAKSIVTSSAHLTLDNTGSIGEDLSIRLGPASSVVFTKDVRSGKRAKRLRIDADAGEVRFFTRDAADTTELNLRGNVNLLLEDNQFPITGYIGDSVKVSGSWQILKQLPR